MHMTFLWDPLIDDIQPYYSFDIHVCGSNDVNTWPMLINVTFLWRIIHFFGTFLPHFLAFNLHFSDLCSGLSQLSRLDLSQSGLGSIPGGDLCALTALTHLNLSANRLQDIADLGLQLPASGCSLPLGSLDLSGILTYSCRGRVLGRHFFLNDMTSKLLYTVKKGQRFFRPQPGKLLTFFTV